MNVASDLRYLSYASDYLIYAGQLIEALPDRKEEIIAKFLNIFHSIRTEFDSFGEVSYKGNDKDYFVFLNVLSISSWHARSGRNRKSSFRNRESIFRNTCDGKRKGLQNVIIFIALIV